MNAVFVAAGTLIPGVSLNVTGLGLPLILDGVLTVDAGATLTVGAGSTLEGGDRLAIYGTLNMNGMVTSPISVTSEAAPALGAWRGIEFWPGSGGTLTYVHLSNAGAGNCDFGCSTYAGITIDDGNPIITNCTFTQNEGWAMYYITPPAILPQNSNLSASGNGTNAVGFEGGTLLTGLSLNVTGLGIPLVLDGTLTVDAGATLTIGAGSALEGGGALAIYGTLNMNGTSASPISFTSEGPPAPGAWRGIEFGPGSTGTLTYVHLSNAGAGNCDFGCSTYADLTIDAANPVITNSTIDRSGGNDVVVLGSGQPVFRTTASVVRAPATTVSRCLTGIRAW